MPNAPSFSPLADIDARQDDLLRQLDDLERKIARVLAEYGSPDKAGLSIYRPAEDAEPQRRESAGGESAALNNGVAEETTDADSLNRAS